jgi:hypothetical protein
MYYFYVGFSIAILDQFILLILIHLFKIRILRLKKLKFLPKFLKSFLKKIQSISNSPKKARKKIQKGIFGHLIFYLACFILLFVIFSDQKVNLVTSFDSSV